MWVTVRIKFDKLLHDSGKAIFVRIISKEYWLPKKLCRNLTINSKLGGNVCIPVFLAKAKGIDIDDANPDIEIEHHIPEHLDKSKITHDAELFKQPIKGDR